MRILDDVAVTFPNERRPPPMALEEEVSLPLRVTLVRKTSPVAPTPPANWLTPPVTVRLVKWRTFGLSIVNVLPAPIPSRVALGLPRTVMFLPVTVKSPSQVPNTRMVAPDAATSRACCRSPPLLQLMVPAAEAMGAEARTTVQREFTWPGCGRQTVEAYREALGR